MSKQDRQGVRTPAGLEQKYNFGNVFSRLDSENKNQNLTMRQFAEIITKTITTIQTNIDGLNTSVETLQEKDRDLENAIEKNDTTLDNKIAAYWKTIYPVGAIYVSVSSTSPATLFGGTWTQIKDTFLLASGSTYAAGSTGGEATHKLTVEEMPSHRHGITSRTESGDYYSYAVSSGNTTQTIGDITTKAVGGSQAHNNMPPYLAVYVWKRTA